MVEAAKQEAPSVSTGYIGIYANAYQTNFVAPVVASDRVHTWRVEDGLPYTGTTGSRAIDADFDATQANLKNYESEVKAYGGKIKADEYIVDNMPASLPFQNAMQVKAFARKQFIDTFEGTGGADLRGIRDFYGKDEASRPAASLSPGYEGQVVNAGSTASGDVLTLDMLDECFGKWDVIPGQSYIYGNEILIRRLMKLARGTVTDGTQYNTVYNPSEIGRFDGVYRNVPLVIARDGKNANLLSVTEYDATTNQNTLSLYFVTWGLEHCMYFSTSPAGVSGVPIPQVVDASDGSNYQYKRFKFYVGFAPKQPRACVRLRGLKNSVS
jgi:hypothetical protein